MKLNKKELSWILYDFANSAYSIGITTALFPIFFNLLSSQAKLEPTTSSAIWSSANTVYALIIAIISPILGAISDYNKLKKPLFSIFLALCLVSVSSLFFIQTAQYKLAISIYIIASICFSATLVFYDSMLIDSTSNNRLDKISSLGFAFGYLGGLIAFIICLPLLFSKSIDDFFALKISFLIITLWHLIFSIPFLCNIKQQYGLGKSDNIIKNSFIRLKNTLKNAKQNKRIFTFLIAYFFYIDGVGTIFKLASDFALKIGISSFHLLFVLLITQLVAFPFTILFGYFSKRIKTLSLIYFNIITYIIITTLAVILVLKSNNTILAQKLFLALGILVGTAQGSIQALSRSYFAKIIPSNQSGEFFGLYDIFAKSAAIIGPLMLMIGLIVFKSYIFGLVTLIIMFILGLTILKRVEKYDA